MHEQPRARSDSVRRADDVELRDRTDPRRGVGGEIAIPQHTGTARVFEEPVGVAHPSVQRSRGGERRDPPNAVVIGSRDDRERAAEAEARDPHAGDVGARVQHVDSGAHVGKPAFDRKVAL